MVRTGCTTGDVGDTLGNAAAAVLAVGGGTTADSVGSDDPCQKYTVSAATTHAPRAARPSVDLRMAQMLPAVAFPARLAGHPLGVDRARPSGYPRTEMIRATGTLSCPVPRLIRRAVPLDTPRTRTAAVRGVPSSAT